MSDFMIRNLSVLNYANGFTLWHYHAQPEAFLITARSGFFNGAAKLINPGDMIHVSARDGGGTFYVHKASEGRVDAELMAATMAVPAMAAAE